MRATHTARNRKNGETYEVLSLEIINTSNDNDGQKMVLYQRNSITYVRSYVEFFQKFNQLKPI